MAKQPPDILRTHVLVTSNADGKKGSTKLAWVVPTKFKILLKLVLSTETAIGMVILDNIHKSTDRIMINADELAHVDRFLSERELERF